MAFYFIQSDNLSPYFNLAFEEELLELAKGGDSYLFSWESASAVAYGRFQNPWKECDLVAMEKDQVLSVRRASGGGAVLLGEGNLNFCYISKPSNNSLSLILSDFLEGLGYGVEISAKKDLLVNGCKLSGSSGRKSGGVELTHCTLLVDFNRSLFSRYLTPFDSLYIGSAVNSIPSKTISLFELDSAVSVEKIKDLFFAYCMDNGLLNRAVSDVKGIDLKSVKVNENRFSSFEWLYNKTPLFYSKISVKKKGYVKLGVKKGLCSSVESDFVGNLYDLEQSIKDLPYLSVEMQEALFSLVESGEPLLSEIALTLRTNLFGS